MRQSVEAIREAATTVALVALTYDEVACASDDVAGSANSLGPLRDRASWAHRRGAEERRVALRMWGRAAALESATD